MLKLIYKDLFIHQRRNLVLLPFFAIFFTMFIGQSNVIGLMMAVLLSSLLGFTMTANTTFAFDEALKFNKFLRAMPVTSRVIVLSRYAACLISAMAGAIFAILSALVISGISKVAIKPVLKSDMVFNADIILNVTIVLAIYCSVLMPILFKLGYMKTRYPLLLLFVALGASGPMLVSSETLNQVVGGVFSSVNVTGGYIILLAVSLLALYGSTKLSISIFKNKEE